MDDELRTRVAQSGPDAIIPVVAAYYPQPTQQESDLEASRVEDELIAGGLDVLERGTVASIIFAEGPPSAIEKLSHSANLRGLFLDEPGPVESLSNPEAPVPYTQAPTAAYPLGIYGAGQNIGVLEAVANSCQVFKENILFQPNSVTHASAGPACSAGCSTACHPETTIVTGACQNNRCVDNHATNVASIISQIALSAKIFVGNVSGMNPVSKSGIQAAYAKFTDPSWGVSIVNQSFTAMTSGQQGIIENEVARKNHILIVQSAGNGASQGGSLAQGCIWNANALCVGAHNQALKPACFSSWENPIGNSLNDDREEPDMLAYGGDGLGANPDCKGVTGQGVSGAGTAGTGALVSFTGTSQAAPAVAASAALLRQYCATKGFGNLDDLELRAFMMLGSQRNSIDHRYSTALGVASGGSTDWRDGAGVLSLNTTMNLCADGPGNQLHGGGELTIDTTTGSPMPPVDGGFQTPKLPEENIKNQNIAGSPTDGRLTQAILQLGHLNKSARVRMVVSWNTCEIPAPGNFEAVPDFDLFLYNKTKHYIYYASQSFNDNNEGFDVDLYQVTEDGDDWEVRLGWMKNEFGHSDCSDSPGKELLGFAWQADP